MPAAWPLDLPSRDVLKLPGETLIPWAIFDSAWYLRAYPEVASVVGQGDAAAVLRHHLEVGQQQGHSPNGMFDEQWHLSMYPTIVERIADGKHPSAFDAYCRRGALDRSAHWLFDELAYRDRYPDLTDAVLATIEIYNGYDHYLRHGIQEDRIGHPLFDPNTYLSHFDAADVEAIRNGGVFQHYLNRIESGEPELKTSIYFDPDWYLDRYPHVARAIAAKHWKCALQHYLCNDKPTEFDPHGSFSEAWYLRRDPGLSEVVAARGFRNGYLHFLRFGAKERRSPSPSVDLAWYAGQSSVRADLDQGLAADAFSHWLAIGSPTGLASAELAVEKLTNAQARKLALQTATAFLPIVGRFGIRFDNSTQPVASVVMVARDGFATTMATIASLRSNTSAALELIVIDCGSLDETRAIGWYVPGAKVVRFEIDIGWPRAADAGRQLAGAPLVLFLSNDAQIAPGSVDHALARLEASPSAGAVGGMILQPRGVIAQAGGILWNDGSAHGYRADASPLDPEANFVRDVDFCSPAFLLARASLLTELGGFDHDCSSGHETVDLCLRMSQTGFRVIYDPSVMIIHNGRAWGGDPNAHFQQKHAALLATRHPPSGLVQAFARHAGPKPLRVLFIEDTVPLRRTGSGFVRANDLIHVMASLGHAVTVFPVNGCDHDPAHVFGDMPDTVEVMHTRSLDYLSVFLEARANYYDIVWVARAHNLHKVRPVLDRLAADGMLNARIVLDTEAVTPHREAIRAVLAGVTYDLAKAMNAILEDAAICQHTVAVTVAEAEALRWHGFPNVSVIGHMIKPRPTARPFARRSGLLFVGAIHTEDSPNLDSLAWFVDAVLPLIETELKWETRLTIAGHVAPGIDLDRFRNHPRITLRGQVADLGPLYDSHRIFVAPTRYAAGAPYKVLEAASHGVPVVASELLCSELDWAPNQEILSAAMGDPSAFAAQVVTLYRNEPLWQTVRDSAISRLQRDNGRAAYAMAVNAILAPATAVDC